MGVPYNPSGIVPTPLSSSASLHCTGKKVPSNQRVLPSETLKPHLTYPSIPIVISYFHSVRCHCQPHAGGGNNRISKHVTQHIQQEPNKAFEPMLRKEWGSQVGLMPSFVPGYKYLLLPYAQAKQMTSPHLTSPMSSHGLFFADISDKYSTGCEHTIHRQYTIPPFTSDDSEVYHHPKQRRWVSSIRIDDVH